MMRFQNIITSNPRWPKLCLGGDEAGQSCPDYAFVNVTSRFMTDYYNHSLTNKKMQEGIEAITHDQ